jgi:hypothetical protein
MRWLTSSSGQLILRKPSDFGTRIDMRGKATLSALVHMLYPDAHRWDIIARFADFDVDGEKLPVEFYLDWAKVRFAPRPRRCDLADNKDNTNALFPGRRR